MKLSLNQTYELRGEIQLAEAESRNIHPTKHISFKGGSNLLNMGTKLFLSQALELGREI